MTESAPEPKPSVSTSRKRKVSGTSRWYLSKKAVDISVHEIAGWSDDQCRDFLIKVRWGSDRYISCPHCGTISQHYYRILEQRWKCKACGKTFGLLAGTVFASTKMPLQKLVSSLLTWLNSAAGQPALELRRHSGIAYGTAFMIQHKMREAFGRGFNVGFLSGDIEMDGSHQSGKDAAGKRGRPKGYVEEKSEEEKTEAEQAMIETLGKSKKKPKGSVVDPEYGYTYPEDRRILLNVRSRATSNGKGVSATRVMVARVEDQDNVHAVLNQFVAAPESTLNTDSSSAYLRDAPRFKEHRKVEHKTTLIGPAGENNNQAEEFAWRYDRSEKGTYLNIEPKYLFDYAVENAFRSDVRRLSNSNQLKLALKVATSVGTSQYWKGFTHGNHRTVEILATEVVPAKSSGKPKAAAETPRLPTGRRRPR